MPQGQILPWILPPSHYLHSHPQLPRHWTKSSGNMKTKIVLLALLALTLTTHTAKAWWDTGHMVVAQIAYDEIKPATKKWADALIAKLTPFYPETHNFVEAATFPDDLKGHGVGAYSSWHYTNIPLNESGIAIACEATPDVDVVWAIGQARAVLGSTKSIDLEKAQFLAFLIHFVGDLHQPLHTTSMYTSALPGGDVGGNLFKLDDNVHSNLHKLWDDGCGYFDAFGKIDRAAGPEAWQDTIAKIARTVKHSVSKSSIIGLEQLDPQFWALEGHELAVNYGFKGLQSPDDSKSAIKPGEAPKPGYLTAGQKVVESRLAAGGYRLAMILDAIAAAFPGK